MKDKFIAKWKCKGCDAHFEKKEAHGCLDKTEWIKLDKQKQPKEHIASLEEVYRKESQYSDDFGRGFNGLKESDY